MARCLVCRIGLEETPRRGSRLDDVCNRAINPHDEWREGDYRHRQAALEDLHARLRGNRPGWGRYAFFDLGAMSRRVYGDDPFDSMI